MVEPATPYEDEAREWLAWARGLLSGGRRVLALLATHHHPDHVGGARFFKEELGLPLWAHERTAVLANVQVERTLAEGDELVLDGPLPQKWQVLHTPGHASDHLTLFEAELGVVVVGDMVASVGTILIAPGDGDMAEYMRQLKRLERLEAKVALPAHGAPIQDPSKLFRAYQAHRLMREAWVLKAVESTGGTVDELLPVAYADTRPEVYPIARLSLLAHLEKLVSEGKVREEDGRFSSTPS